MIDFSNKRYKKTPMRRLANVNSPVGQSAGGEPAFETRPTEQFDENGDPIYRNVSLGKASKWDDPDDLIVTPPSD